MSSASSVLPYLDSLAKSVVVSLGYCQNPKCINPVNSYNPLVWAHIISRKCLHLRWLPINALCLCFKCEYYFTNHPIEQRELFISIIGENEFWELKRRENIKEYVSFKEVSYNLRMIKKQIKNGTLLLTSSSRLNYNI